MSGLDSFYSTVSSIGAKVTSLNLSDKIQAGLGSISTAAEGAKSQIASLNIFSKFQPKDLPPPSQGKDTQNPTDVMASKSTFAGALLFPSEMKYYTKFSFYQYDRKIAGAAAKDIPTSVIILPMPNNLQETFGVTYDTPSLGPIAGAADKALINAIRGETDTSEPMTGKGVAQTIGAAVLAKGQDVLKKSSNEDVKTAGAIISMAAGTAPNPNMAVLFSNIGLRTHSFSYKFAPTSAKELATLKAIIQQLKFRMLPGQAFDGNMLFTFPDVCDIHFGPDKDKPYTIKRCVMETFSVNYTPMGSPAFFKTGDPVMVDINMTFKEMSVYTRKDILALQAQKDKQTSAAKPGEKAV